MIAFVYSYCMLTWICVMSTFSIDLEWIRILKSWSCHTFIDLLEYDQFAYVNILFCYRIWKIKWMLQRRDVKPFWRISIHYEGHLVSFYFSFVSLDALQILFLWLDSWCGTIDYLKKTWIKTLRSDILSYFDIFLRLAFFLSSKQSLMCNGFILSVTF